MCRVKGTAPNRASERCDKCNDPGIRRDRQNLANSVKRVEATIATENSAEAPQGHTAVLEAPSVVDVATAEEINSVMDEVVEETSVPEFKNDGSEAIAVATTLREERQASDSRSWLLNGQEDTPENLAKGLATRQQEILLAGSLIADRAQAIHGVDIEDERAKWNERADALAKEHAKLEKTHSPSVVEYHKYRDALFTKHNVGILNADKDLPEPDRTEYLKRKEEMAEQVLTHKVSNTMLQLTLAGEDPQSRAVMEKISAANLKAIAEVRSVGNVPVNFKSFAQSGVKEMFQSTIAETFPDDWVKNSNKIDNLTVNRISASQRAHYSETHPSSSLYIYSTKKEPVPGDDYYEGWEKQYDENGQFNGQWRGLKKDLLLEQNSRNGNKFKENGTPKGAGWKMGQTQSESGGLMPVWIRENPADKKRSLAVKEDPTVTAALGFNPSGKPHQAKQTIIHEFSHRVEKSEPHIPIMEEAFIASRTTNSKGKRDPLHAYRNGEVSLAPSSSAQERVRADNFVNPYMGKEYDHGHTREILSMGTESVFGGAEGGLVGIGHKKADPEMRNWILGMYAVA